MTIILPEKEGRSEVSLPSVKDLQGRLISLLKNDRTSKYIKDRDYTGISCDNAINMAEQS